MSDDWLVARTKPNRELWAAENVARQGYKFYLPKFLVVQKREAYPRYLFPSYLFVENNGVWHRLLSTFGISALVMNGECPALLRELDYERLREREDDCGFIRLEHQRTRRRLFASGQVVRIHGGLFSGLNGVYQESTGRDRVRILLDYLGRKSSVLIAEELLEAV
jgi:transcriptional antiterminator RfaH